MLNLGRIDIFIEREESLLGLYDYQQYRDKFTISPWLYSKEMPSYIAVSKKSSLNNELALITEKLNELKREGVIEKLYTTHQIK